MNVIDQVRTSWVSDQGDSGKRKLQEQQGPRGGSKLGDFCSTEEFAHALGIKPESVRVRLCRKGDYFGVKPRKLPNGRLRWSKTDCERLATGSRNV